MAGADRTFGRGRGRPSALRRTRGRRVADAAIAAEVAPRKTVAVVGDGAVGLCGVIAAKRLGADPIIILGRHADRIALARAESIKVMVQP